MPLDTSIPLQAQAPQVNPLQQLAQTTQTLNGLQTLKQNQLQLGANQAISQAYAQSLNPDGSVDFNKLQSLAGENGAGAFLPQFMGQIAAQRNQQQQYDTSKLDMALKQQQGLRGMIGSLAIDPDIGKVDMSPKIADQVKNAVQNGLLPLDAGIREIQAIPSDPGQQKAWITNHLINSLSGEAKIQALMPQNIAVDTGSKTLLLNRNPLTGESSVGTSIDKTLTPQDLAQPRTIIDANGNQRTVTNAQFLQMQNGGGYTGRNDGSGQQPGGSGPGVLTALGPAQQAAMGAQGASSNAAAQSLSNESEGIPLQLQTIRGARDALAHITTGPGTDWVNTFKSALQSSPVIGDALKSMGINNPEKIASYDEFKKLMTNYSSQVSGQVGTGTDARLNAAITGNANPGISNLANDDILAKTQAALAMKAAKNLSFQNSGLSTDQYNKWSAQWNKAVNPDAFAYDAMSPDQRAAYKARVSPEQFEKLRKDYNTLHSQGLIGGQ